MLHQNKKIILLAIVLIVLSALLIFNEKRSYSIKQTFSSFFGIGKTISYDGYLIRDWEHFYLVPHSLTEGNDHDDEIWVKDSNDTDWQKSLVWNSLGDKYETAYVKVHVEGKLYGPGVYGGFPGYKYEIDVKKVEQLP